jgi:hypothetical protein
MKYGYARVSPGGKSDSVEAQTRQLTKAGCKKVFRDVHVSGAKTGKRRPRGRAPGPPTCPERELEIRSLGAVVLSLNAMWDTE